MQYEEFIFRVQSLAGLDAAEDARVVSQAAITTLGECLTTEEAEDLASQLPKGLKEYLTEENYSSRAAGYSLEEFYRRVGERAGLHLGEAKSRSRAVAQALEDAVSETEVQDMRALLPSDLDSLFQR